MTGITQSDLWTVIIGLALGSFALRFLFLGLVGDRQMPDWVLRHLRYTGVAILPALVAPLVVWPGATEGQTDPARLAAALATVAVSILTRSVLAAIAAGAVTLFVLLRFLGG